ncbi:hypothetical protein M9H77_21999 [Catharanthus roseus]|uniref:Uncharacterized protein n=1 Tax=Catharanthus roseus TaxID=4058 RepID=A0ACC0APY3_CATRO|nr:hypothetical protein M9H77_21999 [Catharanthus roseus]
MASCSSTSFVKIVLQSIDDKAFEVDEAIAKQSVTIEHMIEDRNPIWTVVVADYLAIKGLLSPACEDILDFIKRKDPTHIRKLFNIT